MNYSKKNISILLMAIVLIVTSLFYFQGKSDDGVKMYRAKAIMVDDSDVIVAGPSAIGSQKVTVKILNKDRKDEVHEADNFLLGQLDFDQIYEAGDTLIVAIRGEGNDIQYIRCVEYYRLPYILGLILLFVIVLLIYAKWIGFRALLSFIGTFFILFKILIPMLLKGYEPIIIATMSLGLITGVIIFSVAGFTNKGYAAFLGTVVGLTLTLFAALIIGDRVGLIGMTAPYAQAIFFNGNFHLDMNDIFYASVMIGASGAAMDIAMDVSSSVNELKEQNPAMTFQELRKSGFTIGRDVIGTMTTTLLLAYSGGYLTLMMMFHIKGTHIEQLMNMKIVFAELLRILVGSLGLLMVAPITAFIAAYILSKE